MAHSMGFIGLLREFLESSTIHGLVYISTAKVEIMLLHIMLYYTPFCSDKNRKTCLVLYCLYWLFGGQLSH